MLLKSIGDIINYDLKLYARKGGELTTIVGFFAISLLLFPFALGANNPNTATYAPAFIWIVALLASLTSLPAIFHRDQADGALDQLRLSGVALEWCVLAKCIANWVGCLMPLILLTPVLSLMLGMDGERASRVMVSLLVGTPILSCIGAAGSALTLHARNKSGVLAVIILPLYIPVLIFAAIFAMSDPKINAFDSSEYWMLAGMAIGAVPLCGWVSAAIIRMQD